MRITATIFTALALATVPLKGLAQDSAPTSFKVGATALADRFAMPLTPVSPLPSLLVSPRPVLTHPPSLNWRTARLADSLWLHSSVEVPDVSWSTSRRSFIFDRDPYARNRAAGGVVTRLGGGYLAGTSRFTVMPALGNVGAATVGYTLPLGDGLTVTAGLAGEKYHFGREAWNSYGVFGRASFRLSDTFTLNAFGQRYWNGGTPFVAALPYMGDTRYGATLGVNFDEMLGVDVGVQRYYDPYTRRWRTVPILAPRLTLLGQPISVDLGGLVQQVLDNLLGIDRNYDSGGYAPSFGTGPRPAGFNPNSPVLIPDALR